MKELSRFLTELSVCDYFFVKYQATTIGLSSILAAMDLAQGLFEPSLVKQFLNEVKCVTLFDPNSMDVLYCKDRMKETYILGGFHEQQLKETIAGDKSPVCVSEAT